MKILSIVLRICGYILSAAAAGYLLYTFLKVLP